MWFPPSVVLPYYMDMNVPSIVVLETIPFDQQTVGVGDFPFSVHDGKKFLLNKSVFDLVEVSDFLELTDPKLLGWYLCLPAEDRKLIQEEGGFINFLQNHPALEVTSHTVHLKKQVLKNSPVLPPIDMSLNLNTSRHPTVCGIAGCLCCGSSCSSRTQICRQCSLPVNPEENVQATDESLGLLPNCLKEELNLINAKRQESTKGFDLLGCNTSTLNESASQATFSNSFQQTVGGPHPKQTCVNQEKMHFTEAQYLSQLWGEGVPNEGTDVQVFKDSSAQANVTLDMEFELNSHTPKSSQDQGSVLKDTSPDVPCLNQEIPPEYYSLNSTGLEHTSAQWSDATDSQEPGFSDSVMATKGRTEVSTIDEAMQNSVASDAENSIIPDFASCSSSEWTDFTDDYQDLDNGNDSECQFRFSSTRPHEKSETTPVPLLLTQGVDASSDFRAYFTSSQATEICPNIFVKPCQNIAVGTDSILSCDQETQTTQMSTSEKCIITEVCMPDLDVLSEEFEYLKMMEEEFKCLKDKMASVGGPESKGQKSGCGCDADQRARQAELRLLALQFAMCKQHCWRRFYTSPLGETALQGNKALPDVISQTLKMLENDYLEMKRKILAGICLDSLDPLSVDTRCITSGTHYCPTLAFGDILGDLLEELSKNFEDEGQLDQANEVLKMENLDGGILSRSPPPQGNATSQCKGLPSRRCRAVCVLNQQSGMSSDVKPDFNNSEAWFDAEEELVSATQDCKNAKQMSVCDEEATNMEQGDRNGNADHSHMLCVTNLPSNITERDLLLWFEGYHASKVNLTFNSKNRVAIVFVKSSTDAEAAVREVNGRSSQGHSIHVEHIHRFPAGDQNPIKASCAERSSAACKTQPAGEGQSMHDSINKLRSTTSLCCSLDNIQHKPSASGTYVPQHYATMGSFDTIIARLSERHPEVSRETIIGALLQVRAQHQGFLSGLSLRVITDMASDLLTLQSPAN